METPSLHPSHPSFPIIAVAIIGILATAFLLVSYYIFVIKCCLNWHRIDLFTRFSVSRRRLVEDPLMVYSPLAENRGLDQATIRSIPTFQFKILGDTKDGSERSSSFECVVCLNQFQENEKLRIIPNCGHLFHIDCIDVWLQNNANCPLCRTSISVTTNPDIKFHVNQVLASNPAQDPNPYTNESLFRDEDYVVIEIGFETQTRSSSTPLHFSSGEFLSIIPSPRKTEPGILRKKSKKFSHTSSMGDECIDSRKKDEQFAVQPIRRSFSMDSADDRQLYLAVQEIISHQQTQINSEVNDSVEGCTGGGSRVKRSFFSFRHGRSTSRNAVQPLSSESQG
ncbi:RING-H2 finger protein ATL16-like [Primulina eburnea]|uniref:RING-H2 finger protein ATL16-like n=1 Tax=Primulina eburnea TaxID=1245227 RepID=UPI003C6C78A2